MSGDVCKMNISLKIVVKIVDDRGAVGEQVNKPASKFLQVFVKRVTVLQIWSKTYVVDYCFTYMEDIVLLYRSCSIEAMCLESDTHRQSLSSCADQFFCFVI
ncbi:hypothetical protein NDU88_000168 [Pleurodeles waltl]|uniref:Uncharacterized protein n=1 Tax=Pleurodeles waltl TaxID=8319 RepID=A0AAV7V4Q7_PLEWA|nr:hypothetical protein NDU88_000168 [Pleurodeles waltl]